MQVWAELGMMPPGLVPAMSAVPLPVGLGWAHSNPLFCCTSDPIRKEWTTLRHSADAMNVCYSNGMEGKGGLTA